MSAFRSFVQKGWEGNEKSLLEEKHCKENWQHLVVAKLVVEGTPEIPLYHLYEIFSFPREHDEEKDHCLYEYLCVSAPQASSTYT